MLSHHSGPDHHHHHQSETIKNFKLKFENCMKQFRERVESRANETGYNGGWRDILAGVGLSVTSLAGGTLITFLATAGAMTAAASAGAGFAIAVIGIAAAAGYNIYRTKQKKREFKRALNLLQRDDLDEQITNITNKLCEIYKYQLENCSPIDATHLAEACFKSLKHEMLTNKHLKFRDLLLPSHLQALIVKSATDAKKEHVSINGRDDEKANARGALTHAALYCEENEQFYRCEASKPAKYGVLFFATRKDLEDYKLRIEKIKHDKDKWHFEKMPASQVKMLMRNQLFHKPENDDLYQSVDDDSDLMAAEEERSSVNI